MWLTLQSCFNQIILHHGDNDYSIEDISKTKLEQAGQLLDVLDVVDEDAYQTNNESDEKSNSYNENNFYNESNLLNKRYNKRIPILPTHKREDGGYSHQ